MSGARSALKHLAQAGVTVPSVAAELGVCPRTVRRWSVGTTPRPRNLAGLRTLVNELLAAVLAGDTITDGVRGAHLQRAAAALSTDAERAADDRLAVDIAATIEAANERRRVSLTATADPFGLCRADDLDEKLDAFLPLPTAA